jgi:DnaJ-class molecular chaperone
MKDAAEISEACNGTGFPQVKQPNKPRPENLSRSLPECGGQGRIIVPQR